MTTPNLFSFEPLGDATAQATRRLRGWAEAALRVSAGDVVTVSELRCGETDCPDLETLVILTPATGPRRFVKIPKAAAAVAQADLLEALDGLTTKEMQP